MSDIFVPVVDQRQQPLMPTTPARARRRLKSGKATSFWEGEPARSPNGEAADAGSKGDRLSRDQTLTVENAVSALLLHPYAKKGAGVSSCRRDQQTGVHTRV